MRRIGICTVVLLLSGVFGPACAGGSAPVGESAPPRSAEPMLSEAYARFRSQQVADVRYQLELDLGAGEEAYAGRVELEFRLLHAGAPLTVDFADGEVREVLLDGETVPHTYNGFFLEIPAGSLAVGSRRLRISYTHRYSSDGSGLSRFRDPEDGQVYVNTDFEPYYANRLFPCFDQPDLKASYRLTVDAPPTWQVTSATRETRIDAVENGRRWIFPETKRFSTYVFSVVAGPFHVWESRAGDIPLRLMARSSLAEHLDAEEWFRVTQQGLAFFETYFGIPYPFGKYDQVMVPDFMWGAMENVGNVTFSERYVRRGRYTAEEREDLANTILHEMAHMWFGDLVTMRWWNGLWLNESFASYMASFALVEATEYRDAWLSFFTGEKIWAYTSDERVTTHAIDMPVANTDTAFANFDGITYGKGSAVLKQLVYLLGKEAFQNAVRSYLEKHAYGNTDLGDFMGAMTEASGRDLQQWVKEWMYLPGLDTVAVETDCAGSVIDRVTLRQGVVDVAPLRLHRLLVGAFEAGESGSLRAMAMLPVELSGADALLSVSGPVPCEAFLYPNYGDHAFIKVLFTEDTNRWLLERIDGFEDPLQRAQSWQALWEAVRDARLPVVDFAQGVLTHLGAERNRQILSQVLVDAERALVYLELFGDAFGPVRDATVARFEALAWHQVEALAAEPDLQALWFDHLLAIASSDAALDRLVAMLEGTLVVPGLVPDQDRRWAMVTQLSTYGHGERLVRIQAETERDPSDKGRKAALAAAAADPALDSKREWLSHIHGSDDRYSLADLRVVMAHLLPSNQAAARRALLAEVLAPLPELDAARDPSYLEPYVGNLVAGYCEGASEVALAAALEANDQASVSTTRALRVALQEERRCLAMKALLAATH